MNWVKNFLIFSLFVLGISVIYLVVTSYQLYHPIEQQGALAPHEAEANEMSYVHRRYVFLENTNQMKEVLRLKTRTILKLQAMYPWIRY